MFYINNYIDWDQFSQLYDLEWIEIDIKNINAIACKLGPALTRAINDRLEVAKEKRRKREEMIKRRKVEAMVAKRHRARGGMSLSSKEKDESDIRDDTDLDQANLDQVNNKYPVEL